MEIINNTGFPVLPLFGRLTRDRETFGLVVKGTFDLLEDGTVRRAASQQELADTDDFGDGDPVGASPRYESDLATWKPRADLLLVGSAKAPDAKPVRSLRVTFAVGSFQKSLRVTGPRRWIGVAPGFIYLKSRASPFARLPLNYE